VAASADAYGELGLVLIAPRSMPANCLTRRVSVCRRQEAAARSIVVSGLADVRTPRS
jgi:hypothetical protein